MKHPNLVWEVRGADGRLVSCLLVTGASTHVVVQYVDEIVFDVEEFADLKAARERVGILYADTARRTPEGPGRKSSSLRRNSGSPAGHSAGSPTKRHWSGLL